jgi:hypothetical protein
VSDGNALVPPSLQERYVPLTTLGKGGMGVVLRARDRELKREVALKLMLALPSPSAETRFRREATMLAKVEHPGVVRVYDHGVVDGRPYLALELLEGSSLDRDREGLDLGAVAVGAAQALDAVHEAGLIHRDVKPANLFRCRDGRLVLTDFGLTHDPNQTRLTATGQVSGTVAYLAPEAFAGEAPTPAWDWWALGVTLFALAEEKLPYQWKELVGAASGERILRPPFARLTSRPIRRLVRGLLDPDPAQRLRGEEVVAHHFAGAEGSGLQAAIQEDLAPTGETWAPPPSDEEQEAPTTARAIDASSGEAAPRDVARLGWRGLFLGGVALALLATAPWWAASGEAPTPPPVSPSPGPPTWDLPFPRDLAERLPQELRELEELVVDPDLGVGPGPGVAGTRPLLDPDPLLWWPVVERLPSLRVTLEWVRDHPDGVLSPEVRDVLSAADEVLRGQALLPAFAPALEEPPTARGSRPWSELSTALATQVEFRAEPPAGPWLQRAVGALVRAEEILEERKAVYALVGEGRAPPEGFPRSLAGSQAFALMPFREQLRRAFYDLEVRRAMGEWLAPAPQEVERAMWALGRAADAGRGAAALKVALRLFGPVNKVVSARVLQVPASVLLGRRAGDPEGELLELVVGRIANSERRRAGIRGRELRELRELATAQEIQAALGLGDWRGQLALAQRLALLRELGRSAEAARLLIDNLDVALVDAASVWPGLEVLSGADRCLRDAAVDGLWDDAVAARIEVFLARPEVLQDSHGVDIRARFGETVASRRARDPAFTFDSRFE